MTFSSSKAMRRQPIGARFVTWVCVNGKEAMSASWLRHPLRNRGRPAFHEGVGEARNRAIRSTPRIRLMRCSITPMSSKPDGWHGRSPPAGSFCRSASSTNQSAVATRSSGTQSNRSALASTRACSSWSPSTNSRGRTFLKPASTFFVFRRDVTSALLDEVMLPRAAIEGAAEWIVELIERDEPRAACVGRRHAG